MIFKNKKDNKLYLNPIKKIKLVEYPYIIMIDTETTNDNKIILDFSYVIVSMETGAIVEQGTWLIEETWKTQSMKYGKYMDAEKRKKYSRMIKENPDILIDKQHFYFRLNKLIKTYDLKVMLAYNGSFDIEAIYNTFDYKNKLMKLWKHNCWRKLNHKPLFLQWELLDLWTYCSTYYHTPKFKKWYDKNIKEYTASGNRKTNAEIMGRYIKENIHFKETHIANEDLELEYVIFKASVWKRGNKQVVVNYPGLFGCWRLAQGKLNKKSKVYQIAVTQRLLD